MVNTCSLRVSFSIPGFLWLKTTRRHTSRTIDLHTSCPDHTCCPTRTCCPRRKITAAFLRTSFESAAVDKLTIELQECNTARPARPCPLSINTPCDHIFSSGTYSTHASALAKGLGTLRNRVLQRCCTTVLHYPSVRTTAHTHLILCRWTRQINGRHIAYSSQRRQPAGHRRHRRPDTDCPSTHQKIDRTVIRSA